MKFPRGITLIKTATNIQAKKKILDVILYDFTVIIS